MKTSNLPLAIEALGFEEESRNIKKHTEYYYTIMRDSFFREHLKHSEGVGSKFEGLEPCFYLTEEIYNPSDLDMVNYCTEITLTTAKVTVTDDKISSIGPLLVNETINAKNDLTIIPCPDFPVYVYLKLVQPNPLFDFLPNDIMNQDYKKKNKTEIISRKTIKNGPALAKYLDISDLGPLLKLDSVGCLTYTSWPIEASKWENRNKPNNWPSKQLIEKIKSRGFTLAPVGHYDSNAPRLQWRIGIPGEKELLWNLNQTQILCLVALRLILKGDIQLIHEDVLSSFHMKNVVLWCAEQETCQWTKENFDICLKTCINRLLQYISSGHFPHYFIDSRNLMNSKMTFVLKERIIKALNKYSCDILAILTLSSFDELKKFTQLKVELMEYAKHQSIIIRCIGFYLEPFRYFFIEPYRLWETFLGHNTESNVKNAQNILSVLKNSKRHYIHHHIAYAKNMLGLLLFSRCKQTRCQKYILKVRKLLRSSLKFENVTVKFRVATFFLMENDFKGCLNICDAFLSNPSKYILLREKFHHTFTVVSIIMSCILHIDKNNLAAFKEKILANFYDKGITENSRDVNHLQAQTVFSKMKILTEISKDDINIRTRNDILKNLFGSFEDRTLQRNIFLVLKNVTNLVFCDMSFNVPYLASEKWAVPKVFQYELLSVKRNHPESSIYGIYIDPKLTCLLLKFLCCQETEKWVQKDEMLTQMSNYIDDYSKLADTGQTVPAELPYSLPLYRVYNIVAYCCVKGGRYEMASHYVMKSFDLFRSTENTANGYIRCICGIFNCFYA